MSVRGRMRLWLSLFAVVWFPLGRMSALADEPPPSAPPIVLRAGVTCLQSAPLRERLHDLLADTPCLEGSRIEVRGSTIDPRSVDVLLHEPDGTVSSRSFAPGPQQCDHLHEAVALAGVLLVRVALARHTAQAEPARPPAAPPNAPTPPARRSEPTMPSSAAQPSTLAVRAHDSPLARSRARLEPARPKAASATDGAELTIAAALADRVSARLVGGWAARAAFHVSPRVDLGIAGLGLFGPAERIAATPGSFTLGVLAAGVDACIRLASRPALVARWCASARAGQLHASGRGYARSRDVRLPWFALSSGPELAVSLVSALWFSASLQLVVPLEQTRIGVTSDSGTLAASTGSAQAFVLVAAGLLYRFGEKSHPRDASPQGIAATRPP